MFIKILLNHLQLLLLLKYFSITKNLFWINQITSSFGGSTEYIINQGECFYVLSPTIKFLY